MNKLLICFFFACLSTFTSFAQGTSNQVKIENTEVKNPSSPPPPSSGDNSEVIMVAPDSGKNLTTNDSNEIFLLIDEFPIFIGGDAALYKFINTNIKYPIKENEAGIQGTVFVRFVVEKDGAVTNVTVVKSVSTGLDEEGIRVIKLTDHHWFPGKNNGKPVRVYFTIPIAFSLSK